jgi:hypothetical protein
MPGFDGTGPLGEGPMTGGGFGYCGTRRRPAYALRDRAVYGRFGASRGLGFARGRGFGRGAGPGYGYWSPWRSYGQPLALDPKAELAEVQQEANDLRAYLKDLEARIGELEKSSE